MSVVTNSSRGCGQKGDFLFKVSIFRSPSFAKIGFLRVDALKLASSSHRNMIFSRISDP